MFGISVSPPFGAMSAREANAGRRKQFNIWLEKSREEQFRAVEPLQCKLGFYPLENDAEKCERFSATRPKIILF
ncbi:hypothetical protein [Rhizobium leguminosarum]|uniref:hypothetical protein n=1 Tax=Rhizobium leguminosarum TaxID=384 RepID=UPI00048747F5|nr:hypothetical protein [Rhizobium leguminosarum]